MQLKKAQFMLKKILWDISNKGKFVTISSDLVSPHLKSYYIDFPTDIGRLNQLIGGFDEQGVPLNRSYIDVESDEMHYYPISIGQFGLALYSRYQNKRNASDYEQFMNIANWFVTNRRDHENLGTYWLTDVPKPEYKVFKPWKSAFAQSRAISILMRAWQETKDSTYYTIAKAALQPFIYDISDNGVAIRRGETGIFYEEYVAEYPTRVLDGHFFALFGIYDFVRASINSEDKDFANALFHDGIQGLLEDLPKYDLGYWVRFNNCQIPGYPAFDPCTITYLQLVIIQLRIVFKITGEAKIKQYEDLFLSYLSWNNIVRMYKNKFKALRKLKRI